MLQYVSLKIRWCLEYSNFEDTGLFLSYMCAARKINVFITKIK